ncbi:hypothetical protein JF66_14660 [Cryobacterium sp. MLB-32]|uniref:hypothetical protein n=1 Tax=Cryobacterium sp. MLB-32 TaxID=1529318 RepID=UPI0004E65177|nr:hypothetical protein [Cryobacterium sp. MLB-32]KFF58978.1 hypothetical protein JF66_14660 [Cryobacterium sp. MLB-32]
MNPEESFTVLTFLYWVVLLLTTLGSLVCAALAFKLHRRVFAIGSVAALAAALVMAAVPTPAGPSSFGIVLGMLAIALAVVGGAPMAVLALNLATRGSVASGQYGGIMVDTVGAVDNAVHEVLRGGLAIGMLERFAVTGAILAGFPEAIAVVVAIKGVGRFTELSSSEARERFIIGTFASLIWACACAALVHFALV